MDDQSPESLRGSLIRQIQAYGFTLRFPGTANWPDRTLAGRTDFIHKVVTIAPDLSPTQQVTVLTATVEAIQVENAELN